MWHLKSIHVILTYRFEHLISDEDNIVYYDIKAKIYSNQCQCSLKLEIYDKALSLGKKAKKNLMHVKSYM
jgi:hypothetical protein